jgi:hypothetical protein
MIGMQDSILYCKLYLAEEILFLIADILRAVREAKKKVDTKLAEQESIKLTRLQVIIIISGEIQYDLYNR